MQKKLSARQGREKTEKKEGKTTSLMLLVTLTFQRGTRAQAQFVMDARSGKGGELQRESKKERRARVVSTEGQNECLSRVTSAQPTSSHAAGSEAAV